MLVVPSVKAKLIFAEGRSPKSTVLVLSQTLTLSTFRQNGSWPSIQIDRITEYIRFPMIAFPRRINLSPDIMNVANSFAISCIMHFIRIKVEVE